MCSPTAVRKLPSRILRCAVMTRDRLALRVVLSYGRGGRGKPPRRLAAWRRAAGSFMTRRAAPPTGRRPGGGSMGITPLGPGFAAQLRGVQMAEVPAQPALHEAVPGAF